MATYEDIKKANETIKTTDIKGKAYAEVNQRIKAFRMVYPSGAIITEMISNENGVCVFRAEVYSAFYGDHPGLLGVGHAYEKEDSTFINKTSYIENCETSAVGRALGMAGFGIDTSVASYEEVKTAMANQGDHTQKTITPRQMEIIRDHYKENLGNLLRANNLNRLEDMSITKASDIIGHLRGRVK